MKRGKQIDTWYPFYIDKWLFGSTRHELILKEDDRFIDLRGIWMDLLTISKKDSGWIRANETTPYPIEQLAGMFCVPIEQLKKTIEIAIDKGKLTEPIPGFFYIASTETYKLSDRWKREKTADFPKDGIDRQKDGSKIKEDKIRLDKIRLDSIKAEKPGPLFESLWSQWPNEGRFKKKICRAKFEALVKRGEYEVFRVATLGYSNYLLHKKENEGFEQSPMHLATWLNNWKEEAPRYVDKEGKPFKHEPRL